MNKIHRIADKELRHGKEPLVPSFWLILPEGQAMPDPAFQYDVFLSHGTKEMKPRAAERRELYAL